jgi:hypothetical protein
VAADTWNVNSLGTLFRVEIPLTVLEKVLGFKVTLGEGECCAVSSLQNAVGSALPALRRSKKI